MNNTEKVFAGIGLAAEDILFVYTDVIDTVVDFPFMAYVLGS